MDTRCLVSWIEDQGSWTLKHARVAQSGLAFFVDLEHPRLAGLAHASFLPGALHRDPDTQSQEKALPTKILVVLFNWAAFLRWVVVYWLQDLGSCILHLVDIYIHSL